MPLFKRNSNKNPDLNFADLDGIPLKEGDRVLSLRYDLGECIIIRNEDGFAYESVKTKQVVNWGKMIDAASKNQKVRKL